MVLQWHGLGEGVLSLAALGMCSYSPALGYRSKSANDAQGVWDVDYRGSGEGKDGGGKYECE